MLQVLYHSFVQLRTREREDEDNNEALRYCRLHRGISYDVKLREN